jgi:DNA-binding GntR family transcriptional regulator
MGKKSDELTLSTQRTKSRAADSPNSNELGIQAIGTTNYRIVADVLRRAIINGVFEPGERLKLMELSRRFKVSGAPVREALQQLEAEGLVVLLPNRGASVRSVDERLLRDIYDLRAAIESVLTSRFVEVATDEDKKRLAGIDEQYAKAAQRPVVAKLLALNREFHGLINAVAGNEEAAKVLTRYHSLTWALRLKYGLSNARIAQIRLEHREIVTLALKGEKGMAAQAAADHVHGALAELIALMHAGSPAVTSGRRLAAKRNAGR